MWHAFTQPSRAFALNQSRVDRKGRQRFPDEGYSGGQGGGHVRFCSLTCPLWQCVAEERDTIVQPSPIDPLNLSQAKHACKHMNILLLTTKKFMRRGQRNARSKLPSYRLGEEGRFVCHSDMSVHVFDRSTWSPAPCVYSAVPGACLDEHRTHGHESHH